MDRLARVCEDIARHRSRPRKIQLLTGYFASLSPEEFALALQFLITGPQGSQPSNHSLFELKPASKLLIPPGIIFDALRCATPWDHETLKACRTAVGNLGELTGLLMRGLSANQLLSLEHANEIYNQLSCAGRDRKRSILAEAFKTYQPLTIKYFVRIMARSLGIGLMDRMIEEAAELARGAMSNALERESTLHVVITSAEPGTRYYTLAVRSGDGFVNIGKAYSGLPDPEHNDMARTLRAAALEKFGRVLLVRPEVVLEIAFERVQRSTRHKAGYVVRFPRILRWRKDIRPEECDDLARIEQLYCEPVH